MVNTLLPVVSYKNCRDNMPRQSHRSWDKLREVLTQHTPRPEKDGLAWSPAEYIPGQPRGNAHVQAVSCFVVDIDDGTPPVMLRDQWRTPEGRPLAWCLHSSYSSTPAQPKYRVVFPLAAPVPAADWPAVYRKLTLALVGDHADPACKDAARLFYLPSCPPDASEYAFADAGEGDALNPAAFPDPAPEEVAEAQMRRAFREGPPRSVGISNSVGVSNSVGDGGKPGDDFNARGDALALLQTHGWTVVGERGGLSLLRRPGKTSDYSATFGYGGKPLFHCFTSSAPPFEASKTYAPFAVYALLEHAGDFAAAAKELARQGYGDPQAVADKAPAKDGGKPATANIITTIEPILPPATTPWPEVAPIMFHGLAGDIVQTLAPHTEGDPVGLLIQVMTAFGSAIGRNAYFRAEADNHYGNLFAVLIGTSSKARKGSSWGQVKRLFEKTAPDWATSCLHSGLSSGEGLIWHVRDPIEKQVQNKKSGEMETIIEDGGVSDKRLFVQESEFASVLRVAGRDGSTLSAILRDSWDRGSLQTMTKNNAARATGAHVSLVGHITADELRRELTSTEAGNGFGNRFLWVCVKRSQELPEGGNLQEFELNPLTHRLEKAITAAQSRGELRRDDRARKVWLGVYSALSAGGPGLMGTLTSRGEAQVMRLALLYALLDCSETIREEHLLAAIALWDYCEASAKFVFGDSLGDPVADAILSALQGAKKGLTRTEIGERFSRHESSGRIDAALALLHGSGRIRGEKQTTGGRPVERWFSPEKVREKREKGS